MAHALLPTAIGTEGGDVAATAELGRIFERNARALALRPAVGRGTARTRVRLGDGLRCEIADGPWRLVADLGAKSGGGDAGPNPGVLGRAALGSCLAMAYAMWAARRGVPISALEVEIEADYDARGYHGVDGVAPGYVAIRYVVEVASEAPDDEVLALLDEADAHCDFLHVFARPQELRRVVRLTTPATAADA